MLPSPPTVLLARTKNPRNNVPVVAVISNVLELELELDNRTFESAVTSLPSSDKTTPISDNAPLASLG